MKGAAAHSGSLVRRRFGTIEAQTRFLGESLGVVWERDWLVNRRSDSRKKEEVWRKAKMVERRQEGLTRRSGR